MKLSDLPEPVQDGLAMFSFLTKLGWPVEMIGLFVAQPAGKAHRCVCTSLQHPTLGNFVLTADAPALDELAVPDLITLMQAGMDAWNEASNDERERVYQLSGVEQNAIAILGRMHQRGFPPTGPLVLGAGGDA